MRHAVALGAALAVLAACAPASPRASAEQAALSACRRQADRAYLSQHRELLSERDTRASPFSSSGDTGVVPAGLGDLYGHEQMVDDCLRDTLRAQHPDAAPGATGGGVGPQMSPVSEQPVLPGQAP